MVNMRDRSCSQVKSCNENHENDLNHALEMCRWLLKPLGVWSLVYERVSNLEKVIAILLQITCSSCLVFIIVPSLNNMFFVEKDMDNIVKLLAPVIFCILSTIKYLILGAKGSILGKCIKHLEQDWKMVEDPQHRAIMLKQVSISRFLITVCVGFLYSGGVSYDTVMQFLSKDNSDTNDTMRPLAYPCFSFLDVQSSPTYEIVFVVHCVSSLIQYTITSAGYSIAAIFVTHICGQIQIQITRLDQLIGANEKESTFYDRMSVIIRDHAKVVRFSREVDEALREVCLAEIVESTLCMCLLEYYCLAEWANSDMFSILVYVVLLISFTFIIFIFCYLGEILSEQCSQMGPASYEIPWYNLPPKQAYNLILVNAIALYPPKLTAGKIMDLSITTFSTVVKTSVVYLNMLRTFAW